MKTCPFCRIRADRVVTKDGPCFAVRDHYPVSRGHILIVPTRHVESFRKLTAKEWQAIHRLARSLAEKLQKEDPSVAGFNLGINDGAAAGQTVPHVHVHLIPRRRGDVRRPRGGVRGVIPGKRSYPR